MNRYCYGLMIFLVFSVVSVIGHADAVVKKPNFVVIVADDLGADDVGAFGHPVLKTPNIDSLAKAGTRFDRAFLVTASCTASRASVLTGLYPHSSGAPNLNQEVPADRKLLSSYLHDAGYYTAAVGKWHIGAKVRPQFDLAVEPPGESGAEGWVDALTNRPKDKPFFFWLASHDPHVPYSELKPDGPYKPSDAIVLPVMQDNPEARRNIAQYYTAIDRLDRYVGKVMDALKAQNLLDNTYVIFFSDNGAPMPHSKATLYDAGTKTPLIILGPHIDAGSATARMVSSVDFMPTILTLAGLQPANQLQGKTFYSADAKLLPAPGDYVFAEQFDHGYRLNKRSVRNADYLYIRSFAENDHGCLLEVQQMGRMLAQAFHQGKLNPVQSLCFAPVPAEELFDVHKDPMNFKNLADDPAFADIRKKLSVVMDEHAAATGDEEYLSHKNTPPFSTLAMKGAAKNSVAPSE